MRLSDQVVIIGGLVFDLLCMRNSNSGEAAKLDIKINNSEQYV